MFNPSEPNRKRKIIISYVTDDAGEMAIGISSEGFDNDPEMVSLFLIAATTILGGDSPQEDLTV